MMEDEENFDIKNAISGVLVVDKPIGLTSHDVVQIIRKGTNIRRAGHTGTLDPRASGVLVVLIGPAVRLSEYVSASDKRYQAIVRYLNEFDGLPLQFLPEPPQNVRVTGSPEAVLVAWDPPADSSHGSH